jgi:hypothetical protein
MSYFYACADPSGIEPPVLVGLSSSTQILLRWTEPQNSGGCAVTSYSILRDSGPNDPNFVVIQDDEVANKPSLRNLLVTDLPANVIGEIVRFKV